MRGKLIVFDGTDSSGKKTQLALLEKRLRAEGKRIETMSFPTYQKSRLGFLAAKYLAGEFGTKEEVGPEISSMFYMIDRYQFKDKIKELLEGGTTILMDRYTTSNIFNAAKAEGEERFRIWEWIKAVDSRLPQPDVVVFLNVPPNVSERLFAQRDVKNPLIEKGGKDIHEKEEAYQEKVRQLYLEIAKREGWIVIDCVRNGKLRGPEDIHEEICARLDAVISR